MKYDCSDEYDIEVIYQKLISDCKPQQTVKACDFFVSPQRLLQTMQTLFTQSANVNELCSNVGRK